MSWLVPRKVVWIIELHHQEAHGWNSQITNLEFHIFPQRTDRVTTKCHRSYISGAWNSLCACERVVLVSNTSQPTVWNPLLLLLLLLHTFCNLQSNFVFLALGWSSVSVSVRLWPTTRTKSSGGRETRFRLIIARCECKHGMWFKIIRFVVGVNSVRGNRRRIQRRLSRTHWLQLCSSVYPEGNQVKPVPDIHSPVPLIRKPSVASLHVTQVPSHRNFHNVVWSGREFFLLGYLANLISKGNKGKGKVEEGGIKF